MSTPTLARPKASTPTRPTFDFKVHTGEIAQFGTLDVATGKVEEGVYKYLDDWSKLLKEVETHQNDLQQLPRPVVRMTGSSTEQDLQGDIMYMSALKDMTQADENLSIWLNHDYTLPGSLFGSLVGEPWIVQQSGVADLWLQSDVELLSPDAARTYSYILRGRKIGVSGGFMILDAEWIDRATGKPVNEDDLDIWDIWDGLVTLGIRHVQAVEWSIVGIPANQRSWVESAIKGWFQRTYDKKLAPIVRALYPDQYLHMLDDAPVSIQRDLEDITPRKSVHPNGLQSLFWLPSEHGFATDNRPETKAMPQAEFSSLLKTIPSAQEPAVNPHNQLGEPRLQVTRRTAPLEAAARTAERLRTLVLEQQARRVLEAPTAREAVDQEEPLSILEIMERYQTGGMSQVELEADLVQALRARLQKAASQEELDAQDKRSKKYKIGVKEGGHVTKPSDFSDVPDDEWADPVNYRYPMHDKTHADDAASRWAADENRGQYTKDEQAIISERIEDRQEDFGEEPGGKDKQAGAVDKVVGWIDIKDLTIAADGSHEPTTGRHTHSHHAYSSQGGDNQHEHDHPHDNDANHNHPDSHKSLTGTESPTPTLQTQSAEPEGGVPTAEIIIPLPTAPDGGAGAEGMTTIPEATASAADPQKLVLLGLYNEIGAKLGFVERSLEGQPDKVACGLVDNAADAQRVISLVSELDRATDGLDLSALSSIKYTVDALMSLLSIPDMDTVEEATESTDIPAPAQVMTTAQVALRKMLCLALAIKEGREFSQENMAALQSVHDTVADMTGGAVCSNQVPADAGLEAPADGNVQEGLSLAARPLLQASATLTDAPTLIAAMEALSKALGNINPDAVVMLESAEREAKKLQQSVTAAREELVRLIQTAEEVRDRPLGRRTGSASTRALDAAAASYEDMLRAAAGSTPLDPTKPQLVTDDQGSSFLLWREGQGGLAGSSGGRPFLDPTLRSHLPMVVADAYDQGQQALIPVLPTTGASDQS